jgi:ABC-2 type transport system ATP-binding protein
MDNAERMCDAVCIIARGEKVLDGAVADVKTTYGDRHVAVVLSNGTPSGVAQILRDRALVERFDDSNRMLEIDLAPRASAQELLARLVSTGASIERFELVRPSLHRIFLDRVGATGIEEGMSGHG